MRFSGGDVAGDVTGVVAGVVSTAGFSAADGELWKEAIQSRAVVVACNARTRCHLEERRRALLVRAISGKPTLVDVVRVAMQLAKDGSISPMTPARQRKAEFLKRCIAAFTIKCPTALRYSKKLSSDMQRELALELSQDDKPLCQRCVKSPGVLDGNAVELNWLIADGINIPELTETARYCRQ